MIDYITISALVGIVEGIIITYVAVDPLRAWCSKIFDDDGCYGVYVVYSLSVIVCYLAIVGLFSIPIYCVIKDYFG